MTTQANVARVSSPPHNSHTIAANSNSETSQRSGLDLIAGLIRSDLRGQVSFSFPPDGALHRFQIHFESAAAPAYGTRAPLSPSPPRFPKPTGSTCRNT